MTNAILGEPNIVSSQPSLVELQERAFRRFGSSASFPAPLSPQVTMPEVTRKGLLRNVFAQVDVLLQDIDEELFDLSQ